MQGRVDLQGQLFAAQRSCVKFVDVKDIGKPATCSSEPRQFGVWALKLCNFLEGVLSGMKAAHEWAQSQDSVIMDQGPGAEPADAGRQLYAVLANLLDGEAVDLAQNAADSDGWEAWRVSTRRFDPQGAGRRRNIMSQLLHSVSFDPEDLNSAITKGEEEVRMYEKRSAMLLLYSTLTEMLEGHCAPFNQCATTMEREKKSSALGEPSELGTGGHAC